ncbi:hypothetical protein FALBO_4214 [Fusarium albosuccineum]|uniref:Uncharacterized protein n=1 Tax=Fusarium albosuccineum TaxID=1237068 RepID=A0A8H4LJR0_9HYPO|nr:hypothetical protein FALBO_4214 [Fusarium albosuccineum]
MNRTNPFTSVLGCLLAATFALTDAKPITTNGQVQGEGDAESSIHHLLEGSKVLANLADSSEDPSRSSRSDNEPNKGHEKGAIIGGTIAVGITLGVTIFLGVLIYKQRLIRRQLRSKDSEATTTLSRPKSCDLEAARGISPPESWCPTFDHRVSLSDTASVYSARSFGNMSTTAQVEAVSPGPRPAIASKAAEVLGVEQKDYWKPTPPLPPADKTAMRQSQHESILPSVKKHRRTRSTCTMSTLGMELLHDTMQPPTPARFTAPPPTAPLPRPPPPVKSRRPPPATMSNKENRTRMPSRRYFVPVFKPNGQLLSPTSPDDGPVMETVTRDESRAGQFTLGENRI